MSQISLPKRLRRGFDCALFSTGCVLTQAHSLQESFALTPRPHLALLLANMRAGAGNDTGALAILNEARQRSSAQSAMGCTDLAKMVALFRAATTASTDQARPAPGSKRSRVATRDADSEPYAKHLRTDEGGGSAQCAAAVAAKDPVSEKSHTSSSSWLNSADLVAILDVRPRSASSCGRDLPSASRSLDSRPV